MNDDTLRARHEPEDIGSEPLSRLSPGRSLAGKLLIFGFLPTVVILMAALGYAA